MQWSSVCEKVLLWAGKPHNCNSVSGWVCFEAVCTNASTGLSWPPGQQDVAPKLLVLSVKDPPPPHSFTSPESEEGWTATPSCLLLQMLRLGFNCGTWVRKQQIYRQNSDARVSGRVVNSSHNTSVYTADTQPATFVPLPCSRWIRIWHKFCTYKISKCHCSRS